MGQRECVADIGSGAREANRLNLSNASGALGDAVGRDTPQRQRIEVAGNVSDVDLGERASELQQERLVPSRRFCGVDIDLNVARAKQPFKRRLQVCAERGGCAAVGDCCAETLACRIFHRDLEGAAGELRINRYRGSGQLLDIDPGERTAKGHSVLIGGGGADRDGAKRTEAG